LSGTHGSKYATEHIMPMPTCLVMCTQTTLDHFLGRERLFTESTDGMLESEGGSDMRVMKKAYEREGAKG